MEVVVHRSSFALVAPPLASLQKTKGNREVKLQTDQVGPGRSGFLVSHCLFVLGFRKTVFFGGKTSQVSNKYPPPRNISISHLLLLLLLLEKGSLVFVESGFSPAANVDLTEHITEPGEIWKWVWMCGRERECVMFKDVFQKVHHKPWTGPDLDLKLTLYVGSHRIKQVQFYWNVQIYLLALH